MHAPKFWSRSIFKRNGFWLTLVFSWCVRMYEMYECIFTLLKAFKGCIIPRAIYKEDPLCQQKWYFLVVSRKSSFPQTPFLRFLGRVKSEKSEKCFEFLIVPECSWSKYGYGDGSVFSCSIRCRIRICSRSVRARSTIRKTVRKNPKQI